MKSLPERQDKIRKSTAFQAEVGEWLLDRRSKTYGYENLAFQALK